jgi:2-polyprenyl-3-methyl-5-hydroxy-6-metoxy-1,4-benzoquinol methylase
MKSKTKNYYNSFREEMFNYLPNQAKIFLEIGCGEGNFGAKIKQTSPNSIFWGMELDQNSSEQAKSKIDKVLVGNCESNVGDLPDNFFDCVIFNDSLEHLLNPFLFLENINVKLKNNGYIVASIPNFRHYKNIYNLFFKRDLKYVDAGILDRTHLRFFTKKSILRLFEDRGYEVEILIGINRTRKLKIIILASVLPWLFDDIPFSQFACRAKRIIQ